MRYLSFVFAIIIFCGPARAQIIYPQVSGGGSTPVVISPSQLTVHVDDWNPTDLSTANIIRIFGDNKFRIVSGIAAPTIAKELAITNVGSFPILFAKQDQTSAAANRFEIPADYPLYPARSVVFFYDLTTARWRLKSDNINTASLDGRQYALYLVNAGSITTADYDHWLFTSNSGSFSSTVPTDTKARSVSIGTQASSSSSPTLSTKNASIQLSPSSGVPNACYFRTVLHVPTLSDAANTFTVLSGFTTAAGSTSDGFFFKYSHGINGGNWVCITKNTTETLVDSGITVTANQNYTLEIFGRPDDSIAFFIDGVYVGGSTTNIYRSILFSSAMIVKSTGTTARNLVLSNIYFLDSRV